MSNISVLSRSKKINLGVRIFFIMRGNIDFSKKLAPLLRRAFRQGLEAAGRGEDQNPYVPDSHLYHAWIAGWAALARGWDNAEDLRLS